MGIYFGLFAVNYAEILFAGGAEEAVVSKRKAFYNIFIFNFFNKDDVATDSFRLLGPLLLADSKHCSLQGEVR